MDTSADIDFAHVRRIASDAASCVGLLGAAGEAVLCVVSILEIAANLSPDVAAEYAQAVKRSRGHLETTWAGMYDVAGVPRRPLPCLPVPAKH